MRHHAKSVYVPIFVALLLSGCGLSNNSTSSYGGADSAVMEPAIVDKAVPGVTGETTTIDSPQVIRNGNQEVAFADVPAGFEKVKAAVTKLGGRIESSSLYAAGSSTDVSGLITARIQESKLDTLIKEVADLGVQKSLNITTSDVTLQTIDLEARIAALTDSRNRLQELVTKATNVSDLIAAEQALGERQSELDSVQSQLDYLKLQVQESTLNITLVTDSNSITGGLRGFKQTLIESARNFLQAIENVVIFIGTAIPWVIVLSGLYALLRKLIPAFRKRFTLTIRRKRDSSE